tara:strand:+ start:2560 stop:3549 length:990 start_codon:yes stop_codon:yes gene_type:complete
MRKKLVFYFLSCIIFLFILELLVRIAGFKAWESNVNNQETMFKFDNELGWISKEGEYLISSTDNTKENKFTIKRDSSRFSGKFEDKTSSKIILIGGSFTQGAGVSDKETFAYQLQSLLPNYYVMNFGQAGYGSIQSLILLDQIIKEKVKANIVIYGFINHHLRRNVARGEWLETLQRSTNTGFSHKPSIPYGIIDKKDNLNIKPKTSYLTLPLREKSALITVVEKIYMKQTTRHRKKYQMNVFLKTILKMKTIASKNNIKFIIVNLDLNKNTSDNFLEEISEENNVNYIDCRTPNFKTYKLQDEYHPNFIGHKHYSECIKNYLNKKLFL